MSASNPTYTPVQSHAHYAWPNGGCGRFISDAYNVHYVSRHFFHCHSRAIFQRRGVSTVCCISISFKVKLMASNQATYNAAFHPNMWSLLILLATCCHIFIGWGFSSVSAANTSVSSSGTSRIERRTRTFHDCSDDESEYLEAMLKDISHIFRYAQAASRPSLVRPQSAYNLTKFHRCFGTYDFATRLRVSRSFRAAADETGRTPTGRVAIYCHAENIENLCSGHQGGLIESTTFDWEVDSYSRPRLNLIFLVASTAYPLFTTL